MKKVISAIMALAMVLSMTTFAVSADWKDDAVGMKLGTQKSYTFGSAKQTAAYKIEVSETGKLELLIDANLNFLACELYNKDGVAIKQNKVDTTIGNWDTSANSGKGKVNASAKEKEKYGGKFPFKGTLTYNNLAKGTYYVRIANQYQRLGRDVFDKANITLEGAGTFTLGVKFTPNDPKADVSNAIIAVPMKTGATMALTLANTQATGIWSSSSESVATVDSKGVVTAKTKGVTLITCTVGDKTLRVAVSVKD